MQIDDYTRGELVAVVERAGFDLDIKGVQAVEAAEPRA